MSGVDPDDSRPSYQQVRDQLRDAIETGELTPGQQLPTHKALAGKFGVATETVKRALSELRTEGLIVTRQGKGSFVRSGPRRRREIPEHPGLAEVRAQVAELARRLDEIERRLAGW